MTASECLPPSLHPSLCPGWVVSASPVHTETLGPQIHLGTPPPTHTQVLYPWALNGALFTLILLCGHSRPRIPS